MKKPMIMTLLLVAVLGLGTKLALSDNDDDEYGRWSKAFKPTADVAAVQNASYAKECGSCHMAYPPGLLPARSWRVMMSQLDEHFGDNAELDQQTGKEITRYLVDNSADQSNYRRSRRIMRDLADDAAPQRISQLPYLRHEHNEIPQRMIKDNPKVGSLSNCDACHRNAVQGSFREHEISIPGYGRWDD